MDLPRDEMAFRKRYQSLVEGEQLTTVFRPGDRVSPTFVAISRENSLRPGLLKRLVAMKKKFHLYLMILKCRSRSCRLKRLMFILSPTRTSKGALPTYRTSRNYSSISRPSIANRSASSTMKSPVLFLTILRWPKRPRLALFRTYLR